MSVHGAKLGSRPWAMSMATVRRTSKKASSSSAARDGPSAWTYQSGWRRTHGCSDEVWFGTKSRSSPIQPRRGARGPMPSVLAAEAVGWFVGADGVWQPTMSSSDPSEGGRRAGGASRATSATAGGCPSRRQADVSQTSRTRARRSVRCHGRARRRARRGDRPAPTAWHPGPGIDLDEPGMPRRRDEVVPSPVASPATERSPRASGTRLGGPHDTRGAGGSIIARWRAAAGVMASAAARRGCGSVNSSRKDDSEEDQQRHHGTFDLERQEAGRLAHDLGSDGHDR